MRLMTITRFQKAYFEPGSAPSEQTIRRGIQADRIPGRKVGGTYYVDQHLWEAGDDELVARVLAGNDGASPA